MKMIFFSADRLEVERLKQELGGEGIECEIHDGLLLEDGFVPFPEAELWAQNDADAGRAFMFCVERETGFGKKPPKPPGAGELADEPLAA